METKKVLLTGRWSNKLNPDLSKKKWTDVEAKKLFNLHKIHGSTWKTISQDFTGRTDNFLKNQFFSLIRRSLRRLFRHLQIPQSTFFRNLFRVFLKFYFLNSKVRFRSMTFGPKFCPISLKCEVLRKGRSFLKTERWQLKIYCVSLLSTGTGSSSN